MGKRMVPMVPRDDHHRYANGSTHARPSPGEESNPDDWDGSPTESHPLRVYTARSGSSAVINDMMRLRDSRVPSGTRVDVPDVGGDCTTCFAPESACGCCGHSDDNQELDD